MKFTFYTSSRIPFAVTHSASSCIELCSTLPAPLSFTKIIDGFEVQISQDFNVRTNERRVSVLAAGRYRADLHNLAIEFLILEAFDMFVNATSLFVTSPGIASIAVAYPSKQQYDESVA